jgi:hypothetical protein
VFSIDPYSTITNIPLHYLIVPLGLGDPESVMWVRETQGVSSGFRRPREGPLGPGDPVSAVYCGSGRPREGTLGPGDPESELLFQETQRVNCCSRRPREGPLGPGDPESELLFQETQGGSSGSRRPRE